MSEKIFGISSKDANSIHPEDDPRVYLNTYLGIDTHQLKVINRPECEKDTNYRHFATYGIIQDMTGRILVYPRSNGSAEERLHGNWSIGWGGHINASTHHVLTMTHSHDSNFVTDLFSIGTLREIAEEIFGIPEDVTNGQVNFISKTCTDNYYFKCYKDLIFEYDKNKKFTFLFDNSNEVGKRHIAVISRHVLTDYQVSVIGNTHETKGCKWMTLDEIKESIKNNSLKFENWSKILIENFNDLPGCHQATACQYGESPFALGCDQKYINSRNS